ncbi:MAG: ATP-binding cassette domain-containing protein [Gammaproteobacteria bacterium]|nr:ATP-binding cassette domain-containing protein [Gammaproteobacteria bacterium]
MIDVQLISRAYGGFLAVDDVSFGIERGEIVGLLGHNGAGKTAIMKIITGFLEPDGGTVRVDGIDLAEDRTGVQRRLLGTGSGFESVTRGVMICAICSTLPASSRYFRC